MAKGKKQGLSAEELLEQALIPSNEQPYEVLGNWIWTRLGNLVTTSKEKTDEFTNKDYKYIGLEHMQKDSGIIGFGSPHELKSLKNVFHTGDILYGKLRPYLNKHDIVEFDGVCSTDILVFKVGGLTNSKFLNYFLDTDLFIEYAVSNSKGINLPRVSEGILMDAIVPLPPLAEQQRIVDCIENMFAKLDQAKELAQNALDSFETRKAAILHKAFTGELTAKWREGRGLSMDSWNTMPLSKLAYIQTGLAKGKQNNSVTTTMPYLRVANVQDGYLDLSEVKLITVEKDKIERYRLKQGDVLFTEGGDYDKLGRGTVWRAEIDNCLHQNHVFAVRPDPTLLNSFYLAYLASSRYGKTYFLSCSKQTTNLASINSTQLKAFPVFFPSVIEQQEIVRILDTLLEKEQSAKDKLESLLDQIDLIKKSILARAFRGELGTNDPSEESALVLLNEVILPQ